MTAAAGAAGGAAETGAPGAAATRRAGGVVTPGAALADAKSRLAAAGVVAAAAGRRIPVGVLAAALALGGPLGSGATPGPIPVTAAEAQQPAPPGAPPVRGPASDEAVFGIAVGPLILADTTEAGPELVLYPGGDALVRERVGVELDAGLDTVAWPDPPDALDPTSLSLTFPDGAAPDVLSSVHRPAAAATDDAIRGLVGSVIEVETDGGDRLRGRLLSARDALVLDTGADAGGDGEAPAGAPRSGDGADAVGGGDGRAPAAGQPSGDVVVLPRERLRSLRAAGLPATFRTDPEVRWTVRAREPGRRTAELAYLTGGLSWDAHYVLELDREERRGDLAAWAGLENRTDRSYRDAGVKLVAGEVRQAPERGAPAPRTMEAAAAALDAEDDAAERAFGELRLYELPRPATLPAGSDVRSLLFRAGDVDVRKELVVVGGPDRPFRGGGPALSPDAGAEEVSEHARVRYAFSTAGEDGVGHDLPSGRVRVYREDEDGTLLLAGEDVVGDVPRGDSARLETGRSFRVTRTRVQTGFRRPDARTLEEDVRLSLRNDREEAVELRVIERLHRWDEWEIVRSRVDGDAAEPRRLDVRTVAWRVDLPPGSERELTYTVRYTFPPEEGR